MKILDVVKPGVVTGRDVQKIFGIAKENSFAIPAVNVVGTNSVNAVLEAGRAAKAPVIIQFSNGGAAFWAGKGLSNDKQEAAILGGISGARHIHTVAEAYGIPVILHTDHAAKKLLPVITQGTIGNRSGKVGPSLIVITQVYRRVRFSEG